MAANKSGTVYRVTCDVPSSALTTVMQVIEGAASIVKVEPVAGQGAREPRRGYANGKRNKGISGIDLLREVLRRDKQVTMLSLRAEFAKRGFSENSASPVLSKAIADKTAVVDGEGRIKPGPKFRPGK